MSRPIRRTLSCPFCHKSFTTRNTRQRFCSDLCRTRMWRETPDPCYYCGVPADTIDHVPPRAYRDVAMDLGYKQHLVKACRECNNILQARALWTPAKRKKFIKRYLRRKYKKYLEQPGWHHEDMEELGPNLQSIIKQSQSIKTVILQRLRW